MSNQKQKAENTEILRKSDGAPVKKSGGQPGPRAKYERPFEEAQIAARQKAFLEAFSRVGTISGTVRAMAETVPVLSITTNMVYMWKRDNIQSFREKFEEVQLSFSEYLEGIALDRIINAKPTDKMGSDLLLITLLNANNPAKYKRHSNVTDSTGKEALAELRTIKQHLKMHPEMGPQTPEDDRESNRETAERLLHERFTPGDNNAS